MAPATPPEEPHQLAALIADQNITATLKLLDAALPAAEADLATARARLAQVHINRGFCHQRLSLSRKALKDYDAALGVDPSSVLALFRRGQVLEALHRPAVSSDDDEAVWGEAG